MRREYSKPEVTVVEDSLLEGVFACINAWPDSNNGFGGGSGFSTSNGSGHSGFQHSGHRRSIGWGPF